LTVARIRAGVVAVFLVGLMVAIVIVFFAFARGTISSDDFTSLTVGLLSTYSVHLVVILAGIFATWSRRASAAAAIPGTVAIVVSLLWNTLIVGRLALFGLAVLDPTKSDSVADVDTFLQTIAEPSSFLVVGPLAFFFTKA
jgi:hypothetical protein